jgi:ribosome maturation factor RimP
MAALDATTHQELETLAQSQGCELVHAEFSSGTLRLLIDKTGGVTLDDCALISRQASALLDVLDFGKGRYTLEVSSPGLDRELYSPRDWQRFTGRDVKVTFHDPSTDRKRTVSAHLEVFDAATQVARLRTLERQEIIAVPLQRIQKARLLVEI